MKLSEIKPYKCIIIQDGVKVFKASGDKKKVQLETINYLKLK